MNLSRNAIAIALCIALTGGPAVASGTQTRRQAVIAKDIRLHHDLSLIHI